jgi:hypothetical protein
MGIGMTLLMWSISECFNNETTGGFIWKDPTFAIFMCFGDLLLLLWMWGISIHVWQSTGIDFIRLMQLEHSDIDDNYQPEYKIFHSATNLSMLLLITFIIFNKILRGVFNLHGSLLGAHVLPVLIVLYFILRIIFPWESRKKWLFMLWQVLAAPLYPVSFRCGYIGDLLTSLVRVITPFFYSVAYFIMSFTAWLSNDTSAAASTSDLWWHNSPLFRFGLLPFLTLFPLWIRLMQCLRRSVESGCRWPHFGNALKYTSALSVISYSCFQPNVREKSLWVLCFVAATLFQFTWDITMDWGLLVRTSGKNSWLGFTFRPNRLLGPLWIYIAVILGNFLLRFAWTLTLLPSGMI